MSIHAELRLADGRTVQVAEVPVPPPASAGHVSVAIPYPEQAPGGTVTRVVIHGDLAVFRADICPAIVVGPGETLTVRVGLEHAVEH